jgi:protein-S-isoprenylcysteine O-methyltransferase Ste14
MTETEEKDGAAIQFPPPFVPLIALVVGALIQHFVWTLDAPLAGGAKYVVGGVLVALGLGLMLAAMQLFRRTGQDPKPWKSTPEIIANGIYRWTRNPMYVGMGSLQAGIGLLLSNPWMVGSVPITWAVIYAVAIRHEEAYLERKFGASYVDYKSSVRRWL